MNHGMRAPCFSSRRGSYILLRVSGEEGLIYHDENFHKSTHAIKYKKRKDGDESLTTPNKTHSSAGRLALCDCNRVLSLPNAVTSKRYGHSTKDGLLGQPSMSEFTFRDV